MLTLFCSLLRPARCRRVQKKTTKNNNNKKIPPRHHPLVSIAIILIYPSLHTPPDPPSPSHLFVLPARSKKNILKKKQLARAPASEGTTQLLFLRKQEALRCSTYHPTQRQQSFLFGLRLYPPLFRLVSSGTWSLEILSRSFKCVLFWTRQPPQPTYVVSHTPCRLNSPSCNPLTTPPSHQLARPPPTTPHPSTQLPSTPPSFGWLLLCSAFEAASPKVPDSKPAPLNKKNKYLSHNLLCHSCAPPPLSLSARFWCNPFVFETPD